MIQLAISIRRKSKSKHEAPTLSQIAGAMYSTSYLKTFQFTTGRPPTVPRTNDIRVTYYYNSLTLLP